MAGPYELYVIRHGLAEARGESWPDDAKRPLSDEGISRLRKSGRGLVRMGVSLDVVLTSPFVRTRQTAEALAAAFSTRPAIVDVESLTPDGTYQAILADLEKQSRRRAIALVGHGENIGDFAARFAGSRHAFPFKKGAVCRIDVDELPPAGAGLLRWFATPKMLRAF